MKISMILAMDECRGIGFRNALPWHLPADLKRFKDITMGHHVIMGRKTYQSMGRPLTGRKNIVITRNLNFEAKGFVTSHSVEEALEIARRNQEEEVFIIGGGEIYDQAIKFTDKIYLTTVHTVFNADVFFPELEESNWHVSHSRYYPPNGQNAFPTTFKILERNAK